MLFLISLVVWLQDLSEAHLLIFVLNHLFENVSHHFFTLKSFLFPVVQSMKLYPLNESLGSSHSGPQILVNHIVSITRSPLYTKCCIVL